MDNEECNTSPLDNNAVIVRGRDTRNAPWKLFKERIDIQEYDSTKNINATMITPIESKKKRKFHSDPDVDEAFEYTPSNINHLHTDVHQNTDLLDNDTLITNSLFIFDYWHSKDACKFFGKLDEEKSAFEAIKKQMELLKKVINSSEGYKIIITPSSDEKYLDEMLQNLSEFDVYKVRQQCLMLHTVLNVALKVMATLKNWEKCCDKAIAIASTTGL